MKCEQYAELILLSVAGQLDSADEQLVRAHLAAGCPRCAGAMAEAEAMTAGLLTSLPPQRPPMSVRTRLLGRVRSGTTATPADLPSVRAETGPAEWPPRRPSWHWLATASALLFVAFAAGSTVHWHLSQQIWTQQEEMARMRETINARKMRNSILDAELATAQTLIEAIEVRQLRLITLTPAEHQPASAWGRVLWDTEQQRWYFRAVGMTPAAQGRTYELWAISDDRQIPAGTFQVDETGRATVVFDLPPELRDVTWATVTDEPDGGSPQPTGGVQLAGLVP